MARLLCSLLLLLAACAPVVQPHKATPDDHARFVADIFYTGDNAYLPYRSWLPHGKPHAVVIALHGFNDYSKAFISTGMYFAQHNVALYAYDQRGFGAAPHTGIWAGEENLTADLRQFTFAVRAKNPGVPIYLLGESMGAAVIICALAQPDFPPVNGAILSAPAVWGGETMNPLLRATAWSIAHSVPYMEFTGSNLKIQATNNIPVLWRMGMDPLVQKHARADAAYGMVELMDSAYEKIPQLKTPLLILYGGQDQVIPREPMEYALAHFTEPVNFAYYPDGYHMLMRDMQGEVVMSDMTSWIARPKVDLPSGYGHIYIPAAK